MQLPSLHLLPCTWLTACKLAAAQQAEGKTGFLLDTHICPHTCSLLQTMVLWFINSHHSKPSSATKWAFCPIKRRTPSPATSQVVWQYEKDHGCRLCVVHTCTIGLWFSGSNCCAVTKMQRKKGKKSNIYRRKSDPTPHGTNLGMHCSYIMCT